MTEKVDFIKKRIEESIAAKQEFFNQSENTE